MSEKNKIKPKQTKIGNEYKIELSEKIGVADSIKAKQKRPGYKRPIKEIFHGYKPSEDKEKYPLGVTEHRSVDRIENTYDQVVKDNLTGKIRHEEHEPLSEHKNKREEKTKTKFKQTEIGKIPDDWEIKKIGDFVEIKHGYAFKGEYFTDEPNENIVLTPGNFCIGGGFKSDKFKYTIEKYPSEYILNPNDIIVAMTDLSKNGDILGYAAKVPNLDNKKYLHNQRIGLLQFKSTDICKDYLYWVLRTKHYNWYLVASASGSTVKHTSPSRIIEYKFAFPPLPEQKAIARILSSLDDKIELNHRMNKTLEAIAQAIFKHWFIDFEFPRTLLEKDFTEKGDNRGYKSSGGEMVYNEELGKEIPKGWKVGMIKDEFNLVMGQSPPGKTYNEYGEGVPFFQGRTDFGFRYPNKRMYCTEPKRFAQKDDTLDLNMAFENCCIGRGLAAIRHKTGSRSYTYYLMSYIRKQIQSFESEGTVFGSITKGKFQSIQIIMPPREIITGFEKTVFPLDEQIRNNEKQSFNLAKIRDVGGDKG